jgi:uncharacterized protein (DUF305 family)
MNIEMQKYALPLLVALTVAGPAFAQDNNMAGHDMSAIGGETSAIDLPEICQKDARAVGMADMGMKSMAAHSMSEAHTALMAGMDRMNSDMMTGGMAQDIDVAFVCSMIPHHRGAIDMAKAELQYGDDAWAKEMAQKVIDAQEQEIADMLAWLDQQAL